MDCRKPTAAPAPSSPRHGVKRGFPAPLAALLRGPWLPPALLLFLAAQSLAVAFGAQAWNCPILACTGIPCPGCGMSRAFVALAHGDWKQALHLHAFVGLAPVVLLVLLLASCPHRAWRQAFVRHVESFERHTGATTLLLSAYVLYYLMRLVFFRHAYFALIGA